MKFIPFKKSLSVLLIISMLALIGCNNNPAEPEEQPEQPLFPPETSMKLDLSFFDNSSDQSLAKNTALSKNNWLNAALRVVVINAAVVVGSTIPVALFAAAISQNPEWNKDDKKFHWIFTLNYGTNTFKADLAGWIDYSDNSIVWEMYVSSNTHSPKLDNFLFYEGRCKTTNNEGYWIIYHDKYPDTKTGWIRIDWMNNDQEHKHTLDFRNILSGSEYENDELKYLVDNDDRKMTFNDASENTMTEIYWDAGTGAGYIIAPNYNEGNKACWDDNQNDIVCPE